MRIAATATVPGRDVEEAVRPEDDGTAVVVGVRLGDVEELDLRCGIDCVGPALVDDEGRDLRITVDVGVVDEQARVDREVGVKGEPEEAPLATRRDPVRDVEERSRDERTGPDDPDLTALLDDEDPTAAVAGGGDRQRLGETPDDGLEPDRQTGRVERRRRDGRCRGRSRGCDRGARR